MQKRLLSLALSVLLIFTTFLYAPVSYAEEVKVVSITDSSSSVKDRLVFYPNDVETSTSKFPVIVWANGTGCSPSLYSDLHYALAKQGYIVIASNETMAADGTDQIASIDYIIEKSKDTNSIFYKKINTKSIVAMGHSQGGRSTVNASAIDSRICCAVSIAGSNYQSEAEKLSTPTLFFTGTSDLVVSSSRWVKPAFNVCKGPAVYISLKGAAHTTCCSSPDEYVYYSVKWINAWANSDKTARKAFLPDGELSKDTRWQDFAYKNFGPFAGTVSLSSTKYTYDGKVKKPTVIVKDKQGNKVSTSNYTVTYPDGRKYVGKYTVKISFKGAYTGTASRSFTIVPKGTTISSLSAVSKGFSVKWNKQPTQSTGYQIRYSTKSNMSSAKTVTVSKNSTLSKKITGLTAGKKYYVQVRTYKTVSSTKYYSSWSGTKSVTTKR